MSHGKISLLYNYITLGMLAFSYSDLKSGLHDGLHTQFNTLCFLSLFVNFILIILIHLTVLKNPIPVLVSFNGGTLLATLMVLIAGIRHGLFKD